jgi:hypothetical protein
MKKPDSSFALEKLVPGAFALQGVLGGILGGLVWIWTMILWSKAPKLTEMVSIIPQTIFVGAIFGAILATIIWVTHSGSDLRTGAGMRVALMINIVGAIAILLSKFPELVSDRYFPTWVMISLVSCLPTTLLVGSRVKPWALFTFGSITGFQKNVQTRIESKSVLATFGTLPLRFLSLTVLGLWILKFFCERRLDADLRAAALMFLMPVVYPALSALVTFRSPRKLTLLMIGISINLPHGLISTAAFANSSNTSWVSQLPGNVNLICLAFTLAWALFLIARLSVQTGEPIIPMAGLSKFVMKRSPQP